MSFKEFQYGNARAPTQTSAPSLSELRHRQFYQDRERKGDDVNKRNDDADEEQEDDDHDEDTTDNESSKTNQTKAAASTLKPQTSTKTTLAAAISSKAMSKTTSVCA